MYIALVLVLLCNNLTHVRGANKCCAGENLLVNDTCSDGSNVSGLSCVHRLLMGPTKQPPVDIQVQEDDVLVITDEQQIGYIWVDPDKYCLTREFENDSDVALVCSEEEELSDKTRWIFYFLREACNLISVLFLLGTLIVYLFLRDLHDIEGKCIIPFVLFLLVAFFVISLSPALAYIDPFPCDAINFIYYAASLLSMNWLTILSFHLWRITIRPIFQNHLQWYLIYSSYGYGLPALLLTTALITHHSQNTELRTGETQCLLDGNMAVMGYFYCPIIIILLISVGLQVWVAKKLWKDIDRRDKSQEVVRLRKKSLMYSHLLLVVGSAYIIDMISYICLTTIIDMDDAVRYAWELSDCRNLLLGGVIFFVLIVMRNKALKALAKTGICCIKFPKRWEKLVDMENEDVETEETALTRDSSGF